MPLENARKANGLFLARLEEQVAALQLTTFPGRHPGPYCWLAIVRGIIDTANAYLSSSRDAEIGIDQANKLVVDAAALGQLAVKCLGDLKGAEASELPYQLVRPLQRWLDQLGIDRTTFFRAEHAPNYELAKFGPGYFQVRDPSPSLQEAMKGIEWPIHRVTVPSRSLGMLPYFAVVAHEAGHAIFERISSDIEQGLNGRSDAAADLLERVAGRLGKNALETAETMRVIKVLSNWIEELAADSVAHIIVGPAFYFALFGFLEMSWPSLGIAETHPPSDLRRSLLFGKMQSPHGTNYAQVFLSRTGVELRKDINSPGLTLCPDPDDLFDKLKAFEMLKAGGHPELDAAIMTEMVAYMEEVHDVVHSCCENYLKANFANLVYTPDKFEADLDRHLNALCALIPPIEAEEEGILRPAALATILNVGWAVLLTRMDVIPSPNGAYGNEDAKRMERVHALLVKAVELAEARHAWEDAA
ncbi:hypothetical protein FBZ89_12261 [Nitrospirillum amazonense]|uniref:Uncharacterized protein n=1 Tax=Nitrospirillum amazonense TaxID=28077 RepID=A0A560EUA1_9PROT|nr:hypothetical protein [Nitrospirillum amazonense]TWB12960.1 hypothetical protein FBZ89_12261 [Nitrospirillum amazonense]